MRTLLIETQRFSPRSLLSEAKLSDRGNLMVSGILATADLKNGNGNGRYYSRDLWERETNKYDQVIKENRATGELDHPESQVINNKNVSHIIRKIWWEGNNVLGLIEVLPTPSGNILKVLLENNVAVGISSRGMGSLEQSGDVMEVQDDFELLCWDFVSTASNPGSYPNLLREGLDFSPQKSYSRVNKIITEILCAHGSCPIL